MLLTISLAANANPSTAALATLAEIEQDRILSKVASYSNTPVETIVAHKALRSEGSLNDFYSEGDYWWPDPDNENGPYIRRDGESNPDNFVAHRLAMIRLSDIVATLASAYVITGEERYVEAARPHLRAWFIDESTKMNPSLLYGQAIKGRVTGRSIGIIDTLHLVEVARGAKLLMASPGFPAKERDGIKSWFRSYLTWMNEHPFGQKERDHPNNHGVCWSLQAATMADLLDDEVQIKWVSNRFKEVYLGEMMDLEGGFPAELARTKPYGYSLFMLDAMAALAQILSSYGEDLWQYKRPDGRGMELAIGFMVPFIKDKGSWPHKPDVRYWDNWPVRHITLLLGAKAYNQPDYFKAWYELEADPTTYEVRRNLPIRHPLLWLPPDWQPESTISTTK